MITSTDIEFNEGSHRYSIKDTKPKEYIPSVTTIAGLLNKPYLVEWAAREAAHATAEALANESTFTDKTIQASIDAGRSKPRDLRNSGAGVGTAVHQQVKKILVPGWEPQVDKMLELEEHLLFDVDMAMTAFEQWREQAIERDGAEVVYCERIVVHPSRLYVGTFDLVLRYPDGALRVVDFKTSNQSESNPLAIYPEYFFQISAYRKALQESVEYASTDGYWSDVQLVALGKNGQLGVTTLDVDSCDEYAAGFMSIAKMYSIYRGAQKEIRKLNSAEKKRREEVVSNEL